MKRERERNGRGVRDEIRTLPEILRRSPEIRCLSEPDGDEGCSDGEGAE